MRHFIFTVFVFFICQIQLTSAQQANPFDILHRDSSAISNYIPPKDLSDKTILLPSTSLVDSSALKESLPPSVIVKEIAPSTIEIQPELPIGLISDSSSVSEDNRPFEVGQEMGASSNVKIDSSVNQKTEQISITPPESEQTMTSSDDSINTIQKGVGKKTSGAFLALLFLGVFLLLTIIVNINRGLLNKIYRAALNENFSALLYRESRHSALNYLYPLAYIIFFLNVGLFLYLIQFSENWNVGQQYSLWLFILIPTIMYLVRHFVLRALGAIFPIGKEINQFNFNIMVFNIVLGLILIPINLFLAYGPDILHLPLLYGTFFIIGVVYIFRQLRGLLLSSRLIMSNVFLFFIYLCTVEILPLMVIFKYIV